MKFFETFFVLFFEYSHNCCRDKHYFQYTFQIQWWMTISDKQLIDQIFLNNNFIYFVSKLKKQKRTQSIVQSTFVFWICFWCLHEISNNILDFETKSSFRIFDSCANEQISFEIIEFQFESEIRFNNFYKTEFFHLFIVCFTLRFELSQSFHVQFKTMSIDFETHSSEKLTSHHDSSFRNHFMFNSKQCQSILEFIRQENWLHITIWIFAVTTCSTQSNVNRS